MPEIADIFRRYGDDYLKRFGDAMLPSHHRAFRDILNCRTEAMGGHVFECDNCGHERYAYHSCRNRSCPKCHKNETEAWLEERRKELLPVKYFHSVFTLPEELRPYVRSHQKELCGILMKAAARSLTKLAADPRYVGGRIGILCVLHTWGRTLAYHPHVHCLMPGGGVSPDGKHWLPARGKYLVPVKALSKIFRGIFMQLARHTLPDVQFPQAVWRKEWNVYCKHSAQGADRVLDYLARYVHRVALTNNRILSIHDGRVTFRYKPSDSRKWKTMTLSATEFIRRFLQHVPPKGFHKVRYYGIWSPANRHLLHQLQLVLGADESDNRPQACHPGAEQSEAPSSLAPGGHRCPHCGKGILVYIGPVAPHGRAPP